jgi:hypothetical protein
MIKWLLIFCSNTEFIIRILDLTSLSNAINGIKVIHGKDTKAQDFTPGFHETEDDSQN